MGNSKVLDYIDKIMRKVIAQEENMKEFFYDDTIVCFRGESADYGETKLMPTLFRDRDNILLEKELIELLCDYDIPDKKDVTKLSRTIAGQHFVQTSRLLDVTFNMLPALYFASHPNNENGYIYTFVFPETFSPNSDYLNDYYDYLVEEKLKPHPKDFKVITHSYNNERIKMQSGGFILFSGMSFSKIPQEYYESIEILAEDKDVLRKELSQFFNMSEATLFPEKDKRRGPIKNQLLVSKKKRYHINKYLDAELDAYFRRIEFEVKLKQLNGIGKDRIYRFLRKEKLDLINYVEKNVSREEREEKINIVNNKFIFIKLGVNH
ncbi:FRG domain-containing protein [Enterococcus faecalis]|uniref:FRG domain-containing protein n=1 Tax=Enterococcus TaxID=1350 RepID=UPI00053BFE93|nr:FRG domain-containing protein [Enterococcus faecalis]EGO5014769.1 FRG domain-containing protein [Enterococcus faecalis]EGO7719951.1 FRG domain-containing protein [Enterococcus faecalis]EHB5061326.1 FRG domain-containing protein [Enterococcus faecalis]EJX7951010.1 FRG domain-containing protein [Enterococcus faecalis]EKE4873977.1 FRG domain-containing protein [Enterococcus faecalis]